MFKLINHARKSLSIWASGHGEMSQASSSDNKKLKVKADTIIHDVNTKGKSKSSRDLKGKKLTIIKDTNGIITSSKGSSSSSVKGKGPAIEVPAKKSRKSSLEQSSKCYRVEEQANECSSSVEGGPSHRGPIKLLLEAELESASNALDQGGPSQESEKLSAEDRKLISQQLDISESDLESVFTLLEEAYKGMKLQGILGEGKHSKANLFSFSEEGTEKKKVLKLANARRADSRLRSRAYDLTKDRMGGEWFALLEYGENILRTEKALAYDEKVGVFCLISAEEVQRMFNDPSLRIEKKLALIGTISEYIEGSITLDALIKQQRLTAEEVQNFGRQIFQGVAEIHSKTNGDRILIHRDLKPENIMVTQEGKVKIIDFGFARLVTQGRKRFSQEVGSLAYIAPEIMDMGVYNAKADSYALGVTLFHMIIGTIPFPTNYEFETYMFCFGPDLGEYCANPLRQIDSDLSDLIDQLGKRFPDTRPGVEEALNHPFFTKELAPSS